MRDLVYFLTGLCLSISLAEKPAAGDSLRQRVEHIQELLEKTSNQLQILKKELKQSAQPVFAEPGALSDSQPLATLLLTPRQKQLYRVSAGQLHRVGVGFGFNDIETLAGNFIYWMRPWGWRAEAAAIFQESGPQYTAMGGLYLLRSLHSFSLMEIPNLFHLFALGGARLVWQSQEYEEAQTDSRGGLYFTGKEKLYDEYDVNTDLVLGVGSEVFLPVFSGVRLTPEIGYKASYYFSRYQDSGNWPAPAEEDLARPGSNFSLGWHFAFNFYFYFK